VLAPPGIGGILGNMLTLEWAIVKSLMWLELYLVIALAHILGGWFVPVAVTVAGCGILIAHLMYRREKALHR
jgi:hypothetical protein